MTVLLLFPDNSPLKFIEILPMVKLNGAKTSAFLKAKYEHIKHKLC